MDETELEFYIYNVQGYLIEPISEESEETNEIEEEEANQPLLLGNIILGENIL